MQPSMFNVRVPFPERNETFLMNTFTDAQLVVTNDVVSLLDSLPAAGPDRTYSGDERTALDTLSSLGFIVSDRATERDALEQYFASYRETTDQLRLTVLTTLQCNFACDYCIQGDHGDYNKHAHKMSLDTAARLVKWTEQKLDALTPKSCVLTFFGGEPLLNLPALYFLAEEVWRVTQQRGVRMLINIITNGLLLTPDVIQRLKPLGLNGVKVTLDGDRETHDRMRPLRGGQGTFDRIIRNISAIAGECNIAIGGNFDEASVESYPALLEFLAAQPFAPSIGKVAFKPVIRTPTASAPPVPQADTASKAVSGTRAGKIIPLVPIEAAAKPLKGACMTGAGVGATGAATSACDTCQFVDEKLAFLREETKRHGFKTIDGVHMGPCEIHKRHAYTIGPEGSLYACPGFSGEPTLSTGHIDGRHDAGQQQTALRFDRLGAWRACGDCSFIPVCAGGCSVAAHTELGGMETPTCHKSAFESALVSLAHDAVGQLK